MVLNLRDELKCKKHPAQRWYVAEVRETQYLLRRVQSATGPKLKGPMGSSNLYQKCVTDLIAKDQVGLYYEFLCAGVA